MFGMPNKPFQREVSCFLVPEKEVLSFTTSNTGGGVEFDFFDIWEKLKMMHYDNVCMIHSHPPGCNEMSGIDFNMVYGWVQAIGKPIMFCVLCEGKMLCYLCRRNPLDKKKVDRDIIPFTTNESFDKIVYVVDLLSRHTEALEEKLVSPVLICNRMFERPRIRQVGCTKSYIL